MKEFFLDDFSRPIETVIKADDNKHTLQEVTEYVVTSEISKRLVEFFDAYLHDTSINGAWISGFFGSGKSHLLKILSFLLENELVDEKNIGEIFADKIKDEPKLKADILKSVRDIPSESILFNIDQQATITSKADQNAILQVFYKVFYDHLGFYGFLPQVAEFELYLSREGKYEQFIEEFNKLFRREWTDARLDTHDPEIEEALAEACGIVFNRDAEDYIGYLDTIEDRNRQSIEDLALKVNTYIESKPKNFRLNFFVDEVGQFIANNTKLMLNLQTIAETLNTKCKGRSWVIVTSQQDLESLIGDSTSEQSDDFSKIQGRFKVRMSLTSSNVDEVIEKRLLEKSEKGKEILGKVFQEEKENLRTLLTFSNVGVQFKGFKDQEEFINKFPFLPYQFDLFQQCVKSLSTHSAFQGKHQSVGERSMLGVFQEVLKQGKITKPSEFVSFDQMYEGLRGSLRSEIQSAILLSERQLSDEPLAIRVLKILFLVKYFGNFKSTAKNISILALSSKDQNPVTHLKEIEKALILLEDQVYIERKGEEYEFLTDIEKDIESAVKDTGVEKSEMTRLIQQLVFDGVMGDSSIRYFENKQSFEYAKRVDGELYGRDKELKIEIITPLSEHYDNAAYLGSLSMGDTTLLVAKLPNERRLTQEVRLYLQTEKYLKQNQNGGTDESKSRIHFEKGHQNSERKRQLQNLMNHQLSQATFYLNGTQHQVKGATDGKTRIIEAFQDLVKLAYHKLSLLGSTNFDETQVRLVFADKNQTALFGSTDTVLSAPEQEILNFIERKKRQHERISLSELKEHFSRKPYGWNYFAVWSVLGYLFKKGKIEIRLDGNILESRSFLDALLNNRAWSNTLIEPQLEFNIQQTQFVKQIHQDAFNESNPHAEAKDIATYFKQKAKEEAEKIQALLKQVNNYPFLQNVQALADLFQKLAKMDYPTLITTLHQYEDALLDDKENVYDPIMQFWNGEQKNIFDKMLVFQNGNQANFDYVDASEKKILVQMQESPTPYRGSGMREVKEAMDTLQERILSKIEEQRQATIQAAENRITEIQVQKDFELLSDLQKETLLKPFYQIIQRSKTQNYIANLEVDRNNLSRIYTEQLNKLSIWTRREESSKAPKEQFVQIREMERQVTTSKRQLETAADVQEYVTALKEVLLDQINNNRKITL